MDAADAANPCALRLPVVSVSVSDLVMSVASLDDAADMVEVIHAAFSARPPLDPPSTAINESPESVAALMATGGGIFAQVDGRPAGVILVTPARDGVASLQRVSVHPDFQHHGIASAMVHEVQGFAAELGFRRLELFARGEFAELIAFWQHRGFVVDRPEAHGVVLAKELPICLEIPTTEAMHAFGAKLAGVLEPGDLIIANGDLGAGKTTLTQGIGRGLGSDGPIISPTFVIARVHPSQTDRPTLVHVDAYRINSLDEIDDLDLDTSLDHSITVVEWGEGLVEGLSDHRLEIDLRRHSDDTRTVMIWPIGERWAKVDLEQLRIELSTLEATADE